MKKITLLITLIIMMVSSISFCQKEQLFNGKDLDNWVIENNGQFSVEDGILKVNRGSGWLRSEKIYSDFTLTMEFRFMEKDANSGIYVRVPGLETAGKNGYPASYYQVQCRDNDSISNSHLGYLFSKGVPEFDYVSSLERIKKAYKPIGEWHTYEITCKKGKFVVTLNGEIITIALHVTTPEGYIGIQGEFGLLEFRKIELELL
jgi:hypothetical protein